MAIRTKFSRCGFDVSLEHNGRAIIERMGERRRRVNPFESVILERQFGKEGRTCGQRIHGRAEVMHEAREGQLQAASRTAGDWLGFEYIHLQPGLRKHDCGSEPIRARSDYARLPVARHNYWIVTGRSKNFRIYCLGGTSGHSNTLISPSGVFSRVGA